jgi:hypothetical protein
MPVITELQGCMGVEFLADMQPNVMPFRDALQPRTCVVAVKRSLKGTSARHSPGTSPQPLRGRCT